MKICPKARVGSRAPDCRGPRRSTFLPRRSEAAFTLIEATVALALFFMAVFAILDLVSQSVRMAHSLNQMGPTAGMVAAELSMTNKLAEGTYTGDFGDLYPDYDWQQDVMIFGTNGMFQVDITVYKDRNEDSKLSVLLFRPESEQHVGDGAGQRMFSGSGNKGTSSGGVNNSGGKNTGFSGGGGVNNSGGRNSGFSGGNRNQGGGRR